MDQRSALPPDFDEVVALANSEASVAAIRETGEPRAEVARRLRELRNALAHGCSDQVAVLYQALHEDAARWLSDDTVEDEVKAVVRRILERNREAFEVLSEM